MTYLVSGREQDEYTTYTKKIVNYCLTINIIQRLQALRRHSLLKRILCASPEPIMLSLISYPSKIALQSEQCHTKPVISH